MMPAHRGLNDGVASLVAVAGMLVLKVEGYRCQPIGLRAGRLSIRSNIRNTPIRCRRFSPNTVAGPWHAADGRFQIMEGPEKFQRFVIVEFPTLEQGVACFSSDEYKKAAAFRHGGAGEVEIVMIEGLEAAK